MAQLIDHRGVKLPPPSSALFWAMAQAAYVANGPHPIHWEDCPEAVTDLYTAEARAMYAVVAMMGGAKMVKLKGGVDAT